jgi:hypothetical protein
VAKVGANSLDNSTTLESNKSHDGKSHDKLYTLTQRIAPSGSCWV